MSVRRLPHMTNLKAHPVLILGATGLIGSAIAARLKAEGFPVIAMARENNPAAGRLVADRVFFMDLREVKRPDDWAPYLEGVGAVVNCAGVLQDSRKDYAGATNGERKVSGADESGSDFRLPC